MGAGEDDLTASLAESGEVASAETLLAAGSAAEAPRDERGPALATVPVSAYVILGEHGRGGLGRIVRARDQRTGRVVAITEMLRGTPDVAARFVREAVVTANLQHPAIVPVYEVGRWPDGQPFYAMKLVAGRTLSAAIGGAGDLRARLALLAHVVAVADALAYAHGAGVIHRDLKPSNVLVGEFGETVVIDWGLAKRVGDDGELPLPEVAGGETRIGSILGTPSYMPPEQAQGSGVDARADVYAIGAMLHHVLAGAPPFADARDGNEIIGRLRDGATPAVLGELVPDAPPDLLAIVGKAMARAPDERYPTAAELAADLRRFTTGQLVGAHRYTTRQHVARWIRRHRTALAVAAVAALAAAGFGAYSVARIVGERDAAARARVRAETSDQASRARLAISLEDRARAELLGGRAPRALPLLVDALGLGRDTAALRFLAARVVEPMSRFVAVRDTVKIRDAAVIPGNHDVVYATADEVTRWDPDGDRTVWTVPLAGVKGIRVADSGLLVAGLEARVVVFDPATGAITAELPAPDGAQVDEVTVAGTARHVAAAFSDRTLHIWDVDRRAVSLRLPTTDRGPNPALSPDGTRLVMVAPAGVVQLVEVPSGRVLASPCPATVACGEMRWTTDSATLIVPRDGNFGDAAGTIEVFGRDGDRRFSITTEGGVVEAAVVGDAIVALTTSAMASAFELADGKRRWSRRLHDTLSAHTLPADDPSRLVVVADEALAYVLDTATGVELGRHAADVRVNKLRSTRDATRVVAIGTSSLWVTEPAADTARMLAPSRAKVTRAVFTPDGARLVTGSSDGTVTRFDVDGGAPHLLGQHGDMVAAVVIDRSGDTVVTGSRDGTAAIWNLATGERRAFAHGGEVVAVALSPDGARLITGAGDGSIRRWEVASGAEIGSALRLRKALQFVRWSPDGQRFAAIDKAGDAVVWDASGAELRRSDGEPREFGLNVQFSPDGALLVVGRMARRHAVLDLARGGEIRLQGLDGNDDAIFEAAFDATGTRLVVAAHSGVRAFDLAGAPIATYDGPLVATAIALAPDAPFVVTGDLAGTVRVWDAEGGGEIAERLAGDVIYDVVISPRGDAIVALTGRAGLLWRIPRFTGDLDGLRTIAGCRSRWTNTPSGLVLARDAPAACR